MALGVLTAFLTHTLHSFGNVPEDASMGVVFTSLFAVGVILITHAAADVDLDPGCVLYGLIEFVAAGHGAAARRGGAAGVADAGAGAGGDGRCSCCCSGRS